LECSKASEGVVIILADINVGDAEESSVESTFTLMTIALVVIKIRMVHTDGKKEHEYP